MRYAPFALLAALLLAAVAPGAEARMLGDPAVPFSAERTLTIGERTFTGKLFATPGAQRHEQVIDGIEQVFILHGDTAKGWLVLPAVRSYVEFGFAPAAIELSDPNLLSTPVGHEIIEGRKTTEYRIEHTARDGTMVDGYLWLTREGIPMKLDGEYVAPHGGKPVPVRMTLSDVRLGQQNPALFAVPQHLVRLPTGALSQLLGARPG